MAIKKKDGSHFLLRRPNPLACTQSFWEESILHNLQYEDTVTKDIPLQDIEAEEIQVPIKETPIPRKPKKVVQKHLVHVLPMIIKEFHDPLYGESRNSLVYGDKFTMEVVIVSQNDLQATFWTNSTSIGADSIVYVPKDTRWWRINNITQKGDGYLLIGTPSSLQPSFDSQAQ